MLGGFVHRHVDLIVGEDAFVLFLELVEGAGFLQPLSGDVFATGARFYRVPRPAGVR